MLTETRRRGGGQEAEQRDREGPDGLADSGTALRLSKSGRQTQRRLPGNQTAGLLICSRHSQCETGRVARNSSASHSPQRLSNKPSLSVSGLMPLRRTLSRIYCRFKFYSPLWTPFCDTLFHTFDAQPNCSATDFSAALRLKGICQLSPGSAELQKTFRHNTLLFLPPF